MKKEYSRPIIDIKEINVEISVAALTVSKNALNWVGGTTGSTDSVDWD